MDDGKRKMVIKTTRKRDEKRIGGIGNKLYCLIIFVICGCCSSSLVLSFGLSVNKLSKKTKAWRGWSGLFVIYIWLILIWLILSMYDD